jgi:hypothetical protein
MPLRKHIFSAILVFGTYTCDAVYTTLHVRNLFASGTKTMDNAVAMPSQDHS